MQIFEATISISLSDTLELQFVLVNVIFNPLAVSETSFVMNDSHVELSLNSSHWSFGQSGSLWFRTRESAGLLMYAGRRPGGGNLEFLLLDITSGQARFTADLGAGMVFAVCTFFQ